MFPHYLRIIHQRQRSYNVSVSLGLYILFAKCHCNRLISVEDRAYWRLQIVILNVWQKDAVSVLQTIDVWQCTRQFKVRSHRRDRIELNETELTWQFTALNMFRTTVVQVPFRLFYCSQIWLFLGIYYFWKNYWPLRAKTLKSDLEERKLKMATDNVNGEMK